EHAYLVVAINCSAKSIADLRGQKLDVPYWTRGHCRVFVEQACRQAGASPADFFASIEKSAAQVDALDDVARDKVQAAVVDTFTIEFYKEIKGPTFRQSLRVLKKSEVFPPPVMAYKRGAVDKKILEQFRNRLLEAHTT